MTTQLVKELVSSGGVETMLVPTFPEMRSHC